MAVDRMRTQKHATQLGRPDEAEHSLAIVDHHAHAPVYRGRHIIMVSKFRHGEDENWQQIVNTELIVLQIECFDCFRFLV
ncbi:MAG: hypothetical protein GY820_40365 [Gammaproteobacteria bacterium]|nr:hypothetical protein [Gammaproteobacteria bacterium]